MFSGRVILAGPANVGKTALIERYTENRFRPSDTRPTLGCDSRSKTVRLESGEQVVLNIIDTAGQERYAELSSAYFRNADLCLLCFDLSNIASFDNIRWWKQKVESMNSKCFFILVGTKSDLNPEINIEYAIRFAKDSNNIPFFTTSALHGGEEIEQLFNTAALRIVKIKQEASIRQQNPPKTIKLEEAPSEVRQTSCC
jgi:small GTP-binding protein